MVRWDAWAPGKKSRLDKEGGLHFYVGVEMKMTMKLYMLELQYRYCKAKIFGSLG